MKHLQIILVFALLLSLSFGADAQLSDDAVSSTESGTVVGLGVLNNDTLPMIRLDEIPIVSTRLRSPEDERAYQKLKRNIAKVYPYAQRAIELLNEIDEVNATLDKRRHRKRYLNALESQLKDQFKGELKKMSTSQGKVLIKIIERETDQTFYQHVRKLKNPVSALFWQTMGRTFGYDLKEGFDPIKYHDMDEILTHLEENGMDFIGIRYKTSEALESFTGPPDASLVIRNKKKRKNNN